MKCAWISLLVSFMGLLSANSVAAPNGDACCKNTFYETGAAGREKNSPGSIFQYYRSRSCGFLGSERPMDECTKYDQDNPNLPCPVDTLCMVEKPMGVGPGFGRSINKTTYRCSSTARSENRERSDAEAKYDAGFTVSENPNYCELAENHRKDFKKTVKSREKYRDY